MAGRIAGITVEIGGNATKLQSALKGVDAQLRAMRSGLVDVNRQLKFNPTSTTLLTQKQQLLKKSIEDTRSRLDTLKQAQKQMDDKGVSKQSEDYQRLQREIIATEGKLKGLEREYAQVASIAGAKLQGVGVKMKEIGQKATEAGQAVTKGLTAPIVAMSGLAVKAFSDVDKGMDAIVKKTGATGEALNAMKDSAKTLATSIPTDFQTAGDAVGQVATRFKLSGSELESLSGQFVKFAKLNNTDVSTSINSVQSAMAAFGLSSKDAGSFLDTLNAVGQKTGANVDQLAQSMTTNAASLKALGFSASDAANFLGQLSVNGIDSSQVMAGLKRAFANAAKEGKPLDQKLAELQDTMKNADTDTQAYAEALAVFGNRAGPALAAAIRDGRLSLDQLGTSLQDNVGNIDKTFEETLDPVDKFKMAINQAKVAGADLGNALLTRLTPMIEKFQDWIAKLGEKFKSLSPAQQDMIIKVGLLTAAIGPLMLIFGKLTSVLGTVVGGVGRAVSAFAALSAGIPSASAIGLSIGAIGALGFAFYELHKAGKKAVEAQYDFSKAQKDSLNSVNESVKAYNDAANAADKETDSIAKQFQQVRLLQEEYNSLVDAKGNIAQKDQEHADAILGNLAAALGMEKSEVKALIDENGKLTGSIDKVIQKKEAQAYLDANYDSYVKALKLETENNENLARSLSALSEKQSAAAQAKANLAQRQQEYNNALANGERNLGSYKTRIENAQTAYEAANGKVKEAEKTVQGYANAARDASTRVQNYSNLQAAVQSGDLKKINEAMKAYQSNLKTSSNATAEELQKQAKDYDKMFKAIEQAYKDGDKGVTKQQVENMRKLKDQADKEADIAVKAAKKAAGGMENEMKKGAKNVKGVFPVNVGKAVKGSFSVPDIWAEIKSVGKGVAKALFPKFFSSVKTKYFATGYENPKLFTNPSIYGGAVFGDKGTSRGGELVYGRENLMKDIAAAVGGGTTINVTVNGAESPEAWADRFVQQYKLQTRTV